MGQLLAAEGHGPVCSSQGADAWGRGSARGWPWLSHRRSPQWPCAFGPLGSPSTHRLGERNPEPSDVPHSPRPAVLETRLPSVPHSPTGSSGSRLQAGVPV